MKNIIIIGSRGYLKNYGGWETFVTELVRNFDSTKVKFHIPEVTNDYACRNQVIFKDNVSCLQVYVPSLGFATMFVYAIKALVKIKKYIRENHLKEVIIYILGCRVGPIYGLLIHSLKKQGIPVYLNPDGLEWTRDKWNAVIKQCFKISESCMVKHSDAIICDSKAIEEYIKNRYRKWHKKTYFIPYGAYLNESEDKNDIVTELFRDYDIKEGQYYLIVGRFVPENNYEVILKEFMKTNIKKDLVIVTNLKEDKFYQELKKKTAFDTDKRIKFVGSIYDHAALLYIRRHAYAYIHGHSAGGTNPSLLEALANTKLNILYHAVYNVEVGTFACFYFSKRENDLKNILEKVDKLDAKSINKYEKLAKNRIKDNYTWSLVVDNYKKVWKI